MSFAAQVFRILIASPSDVTEEREIAVRTIQEWNDLNSFERQIVLLPLRWETHTAPVYGERPQEVINHQIVDHCDLLIGIFWTRIGSPTGEADSGTIEEIERVAKDGKPVMLYFSSARQDPEVIDLDQLARLRAFKKITFPKALVEQYAGVIEFKDKLSKQIELQLRTILAERAGDGDNEDKIRPITDIVLHFADPESGKDNGVEKDSDTIYINLSDFDKVPDYMLPGEEGNKGGRSTNSDLLASIKLSETNRDYYRQRVTSIVLQEFFLPLRFSLKNRGGVGARDIHIDLRVAAEGNQPITFIAKHQFPTASPSRTTSGVGLMSQKFPNSPFSLLEKEGLAWTTSFDVNALQPQRVLSPEVGFLIGAKESCDVVVTATIFADTLPIPAVQQLKIRLKVNKVEMGAEEILTTIVLPTETPVETTAAQTHSQPKRRTQNLKKQPTE